MLSDSDRHKLERVHAELGAAMARVLEAMRALGHPMLVTEGLRTLARQQQLYAQGRTVPGPIVTHVDGVRVKSKHQTGDAVDCVFVDAKGRPTWDLVYPWQAYGALVKAVGLVWGGDWTRLRDYPHAERDLS